MSTHTPPDQRWDHQPMRIAALQVESPPADSLPVLNEWHKMNFNVEQLLHVYGDSYFGLYDAPRHEARLREYVASAHAKGIKIIAYANVMGLPTVKREPMDSWLQVNADGKPAGSQACYNSPYRGHALHAMKGVMECGADGVFLDGPHWSHSGCYCTHCAQAFRARYSADLPHAPKDADLWQKFQDFRRDSITSFVRDAHDLVHAIKPDGVLYLNHFVYTASSGDGQSTRDLWPLMDWIGSEGGFTFYGFPQKNLLWKTGSTARILEAIAPDKPRVIFVNGANCPWNYLIHTPAETELMLAATNANAASHWYCFCVGLEDFKSPGADAARLINARLQKHAAYFTQTRSAARVGLLWSQDSLEHFSGQAPESDLNLTGGHVTAPNSDIPLVNEPGWTLEGLPSAKREPYESFNAAYGMLWRSQVAFDIVHDQYTDAQKLSRYAVLIVPNVICMRAETVELLREYVRGGGKLIASFESSLADQNGRRTGNFLLADVFGVDFGGGMKDFHHFAKMDVPVDSVIGRGIFRSVLPAHRYGLVCQATTARPLARYYGPCKEYYGDLPPPDMPSIYHNRFGKGECYYFTHKFFENYTHYGFGEYLRILGNMLDSMMPRQLAVRTESETVEAVLRCQDAPNRLILHLLNYTGSHIRPIPQTVSVHDVGVQLRTERKPARVLQVFSGQDLPFTYANGLLEFTVPTLGTYDVLSVE
ncbi:MAG: beta-galactosidase trimerization domain-containing protein [Lentisphaerae bacterium]|nr:beta-galactosidase trimerization domain-containing protein [Lentisphaerota bacterium]